VIWERMNYLAQYPRGTFTVFEASLKRLKQCFWYWECLGVRSIDTNAEMEYSTRLYDVAKYLLDLMVGGALRASELIL